MIKISKTTSQIIVMMIALSLLCLGISVFFVKDIIMFLIGLLFGSIFSILKIILLEKTLNKAIDMEKSKAINYTRFNYVLRYFLTFLVLIIAVYRRDIMDLFGVIIGLILTRPAIYFVNLINKKSI